MNRPPHLGAEEEKSVHFPRGGIDLSRAFSRQPNRPLDGKSDYARTCAIGVNVRGFEAVTNRARGGSRPGLDRYIKAQVAGTEFIVQELNLVVGTSVIPGGGSVQTSTSGRVVTLVAVSQGDIYTANAGDTAWVAANNNTGESPALNFTGVMQSTANQQKLWFVDGTNAVVFTPATNSVDLWTATAGTFPVDGNGNLPRLICTWRGRNVLSGLLLDPQNWFMSAVDAPTDFDYAPLSQTPTQAVAGNNSPLGLVGDVVTTLIPYTDDILIMGGDHTIYMMRGDPMAGGQIDLISDAIGMAWGAPWCKDPYGNVYFWSNRNGIYTLVPGNQPQRISQAIEQLIQPVDTGANIIRLQYDDRYQGVHCFITPADAPAAAVHYFYETRTGSWFQDKFANNSHNPLCCVTYDGNLATDRVPLIGCWDGYVRAISATATTDDLTPIASEVWIGPFRTENADEIMTKAMQADMGADSNDVTWSLFVGPTPELAIRSSPAVSGIWSKGHNLSNYIRTSGHASYIRITGVGPWAMEQIRITIATLGKVRMRGR